jgi:hypothetical protein
MELVWLHGRVRYRHNLTSDSDRNLCTVHLATFTLNNIFLILVLRRSHDFIALGLFYNVFAVKCLSWNSALSLIWIWALWCKGYLKVTSTQEIVGTGENMTYFHILTSLFVTLPRNGEQEIHLPFLVRVCLHVVQNMGEFLRRIKSIILFTGLYYTNPNMIIWDSNMHSYL